MVAIGIVELFVMAIGLGMMAVTLTALVLIVTQPAEAWKASGHVQWVWLLVVLALPVVGGLAYLVLAHRDVSRANRNLVGMTR
jgi:hypothetical protein